MSVLIKGMKKPENCWECQIGVNATFHEASCPFAERIVTRDEFDMHSGIHPDCPLVEVPEPHGRLIDAEVVNSALKKRLLAVDTAPTVIEAEEARS